MNEQGNTGKFRVIWACILLLAGSFTESHAKCLTPPGDLDGAGTTNVADVQCSVLMVLWDIAGRVDPVPICLKAQVVDSDINCDGVLNVSDTVLTIRLALSLSLPITIDADQDGCPELCEFDTDGDGEPNLTDCAPFDPLIYPGAPERCNGIDDSCNGLRDDLGSASGVSCSDDDACNGLEICEQPGDSLGLMFSELMINPGQAGEGDDANLEWIEIFNPTNEPIDLRGYFLRSGSLPEHVISAPKPVIVKPGGFAVLVANDDIAVNGGVYTSYRYIGVPLPNTAGTLRLTSPEGELVDVVNWNTATGWTIEAGASIGLIDLMGPNSLPSHWTPAQLPWRPFKPAVLDPPAPAVQESDKGTPGGPTQPPALLCSAGPPPQCEVDNLCIDWGCDAIAGCTAIPNTLPCDDNNACTAGDQCGGGECVSGAPVNCDDGNACTFDQCDPAVGCTHEFTTGSCDDGDACTTGDNCDGQGACIGVALDCEDNNPCTNAGCDPATGCTLSFSSDPCDDGNACTTVDVCSQGTCAPGAALLCDDGNPCTTDSCEPAAGCVNTPNSEPCEDGNACTMGDICSAGTCSAGTLLDCDDNNPCTNDTCSASDGCLNTANAESCDDLNACTAGDVCQGGACVPGLPLDCDDENPCTDDECDSQNGCVYAPNDALCNDENPCTSDDACIDSECVGGNLIVCDDSDACTSDTCDPSGGCVFVSIVAACNDDNACTDNSCDPETGCVVVFNTEPCDDADICSDGDACVLGACIGGPVKDCSDGNPCTANGCFNPVGCVALPLSGPACSDGDACTSADLCVGGACAAGAPIDCNDNNPCTDDSCDPDTGCVNTPNAEPCDDGNACTTGGICDEGGCVPGAALDCDDNNACTDDSCEPGSGCAHAPIAAQCNDNNPCTDDTCHVIDGCVNTPNTAPCDDGNACTVDETCENSACAPGTALECNDGNPCTDDSCHEQSGCVFAPNGEPCDDGNTCTVGDICEAGACTPGAPLDCDDENACTADTCDPTDGCVHTSTAAQCDDGNPCTDNGCNPDTGCTTAFNMAPCNDGDSCTSGDVCANGSCTSGAPVDCDDNNPCTANTCVHPGGCVTVPIGNLPCDDGNACTTGNLCANGTCAGGNAIHCDDNNPCTDDSCDPDTGCVNTPNAEPCDDGNACTTGDICDEGGCVPGAALDCDDNNACTSDSCEPASGCAHAPIDAQCDDNNPCTDDSCDAEDGCVNTPNTAPCDDGNACTAADVCANGFCTAGSALNCDDNNPCTDDSCEPSSGCTHAPNDEPCNDGNACTVGDICEAGACSPGTPLECNDNNPCTDDSCDITSGCMNGPNTVPCDDENACTTGDVCSEGSCTPGAALNCDDNNPCTEDTCDTSIGCTNTPNSDPCDDGNACTVGDICAAGTCTPGAPLACDDSDACTSDGCDPASGCTHISTAAQCDDGNPCTDNACNPASGCTTTSNSAACDDGNVCTTDDVCANGTCVGGAAPNCDDDNPCTVDGCFQPMGCLSLPISNLPCDDENACTGSDTCQSGTCVGAPIACDDNNPCTQDACDPAEGCLHAPIVGPCDDGNPCTYEDACNLAGLCTGALLDCNDNNPCTDDTCTPTGECVHIDNSSVCDDNDPCTQGDQCSEGVCNAGAPLDCDDGNSCTENVCVMGTCATVFSQAPCEVAALCGTGTCSQGFCVIGGTHCDDNNPCTADACVEGECVHSPQPGPCSDGDPCTVGDSCMNGVCGQGNPLVCDDANPCTDDVCASGSCLFVPLTGSCNVASLCLTGTCAQGLCLTSSLPCDDGNPCTNDACDAGTGCVHTANNAPCDDGNACTEGETCTIGACSGGTPVDCDDGNICTTDFCFPQIGCLPIHNAAFCDDGNPCTTGDRCDDGECQPGLTANCDDGDPCTDDFCHPTDGCSYALNTAPCNDGNLCTTDDVCVAGQCIGTPRSCASDANPCSAGVCDPATGNCIAAAVDGTPCDDGNQCTLADTCQSGQCIGTLYPPCSDPSIRILCLLSGEAGSEVECPIRVVRTTEASDPATGLQLEIEYPLSAELLYFSDGELCFTPEFCMPWIIPDPFTSIQSGHSFLTGDPVSEWQGGGGFILVHLAAPSTAISGAFFEGTQVVGSDLVLTAHFNLTQTVSPLAPLVVEAPFVTATDGNAEPIVAQVYDLRVVTCSEPGACNTFACDPDDPLACDDGNPCTADTCIAGLGCFYDLLTGPCSDSNPCTTGDSCQNGFCTGTPVGCPNDSDPCTIDVCNPVDGTCGVPAPNGTPCNDGLACTFPDQCIAGACTATPFEECDDPDAKIICVLTGLPGDLVDCPVRLARPSASARSAAALQLELEFPGNLVLENFTDGDFCIGDFCLPWVIPDFFGGTQTGHTAILSPNNLEDWSGGGGLILVNLTDPGTPLNDAYIQSGEIVGDPTVLTMRFRLGGAFPSASPAVVRATFIASSDADAEPLTSSTTQLLTVTAP